MPDYACLSHGWGSLLLKQDGVHRVTEAIEPITIKDQKCLMNASRSLAAVSSPFAKERQSLVLGYVEQLDFVHISGWAFHREGKALNVELRLDERIYPLSVEWHRRADVARHYGSQYGQCGFRAQLPSELVNELWDAVQADRSVEVLANATVLPIMADLQKLKSLGGQPEWVLRIRYEHFVREGNNAVAKRQWEEAETLFKQAILIRPDDVEVLWALTQVLENLGRVWEAIEVCDKATALNPEQAEWHYRHACLLERMRRWEQAADAYRTAIQLRPQIQEWHYRLAYVLELLGHQDQAETEYLYAIEFDKTGEGKQFGPGVYHARRGLWQQAAAAYEATAASYPENAELFFRLGMAYDRCYQWQDAVNAFAKAIELKDSEAYWHYRLGFARERQEDWNGAAVAYQAAVERSDGHQSYWYYRLGYVLWKAGRYEQACSAFEQTRKSKSVTLDTVQHPAFKFLEKKPEYKDYVLSLPKRGDVVLYMGATDESLGTLLYQDLQRRLVEQQSNVKVYIWVHHDKSTLPGEIRNDRRVRVVTHGSDLHLRCLATAGEVVIPDSLPASTEILETGSDLALRHYQLGQIFEQCQRWELAAKAYSMAIRLDSTNADWYWHLGLAYEQLSNWAKAADAYKAAVERNDDHDGYWWFRLGYVLHRLGKPEEACEAYRWTRILGRPYGVDISQYTRAKDAHDAAQYAEYLDVLPIQECTILYESYHGSSMSCNPYAIFRHVLGRPEFSGWRHIWVINDKNRIPQQYKERTDIVFIERGSQLYLRYLATAKYLINNVTFPEYFIRREGQIYLNTWHGTPLKTLGKDIQSQFFEHRNASRNFLHATHMISPNPHTTHILAERYDLRGIFAGQFAESGYPRIDLTLTSDEQGRDALRRRLGLDPDQKVVLYAPTWRGTSTNKRFDDTRLLQDVESLASTGCALLFRGHHMVEGLLADKLQGVRVVPQDIDTNELLGIVDVLITDYSSIFYDYLVTGRPIIHYVYDYEEYKAERGLYFPIEEWPGEICRSIVEVKKALDKCLFRRSHFRLESPWQPSPVYRRAQQVFCVHDDGHATSRVVDWVFHGKALPTIQLLDARKRIAFFEGHFMPNGISSSFISLLNNLDYGRYVPVVAVSPSDIGPYAERQAEFAKIPEGARVVGRCGRMVVSPEERWIIDRFSAQNELPSSQWTVMQAAYRREFVRMFGHTMFHIVVNFEGYSRMWASILGLGAPEAARKVIYQHNDMDHEWKTRFHYLNGIFNMLRFHDYYVSVAVDSCKANRDNLADAYGLPPENFRHVSNTIVPQRIRDLAAEELDETRHPWFNDPEVKTFINVARLSPEKDQAKLIDAFAEIHQEFPATQLLILGDGPLYAELGLQIERLGLGNAVRLLGQQANPFPFVKKADCFVFSSNYEGQGLALVEALILGKPAISTDVPGPHSVLEPGYGLLVENSVQGLVDGMRQYLNGTLECKPFDAESYVTESMKMFYAHVCGEAA